MSVHCLAADSGLVCVGDPSFLVEDAATYAELDAAACDQPVIAHQVALTLTVDGGPVRVELTRDQGSLELLTVTLSARPAKQTTRLGRVPVCSGLLIVGDPARLPAVSWPRFLSGLADAETQELHGLLVVAVMHDGSYQLEADLDAAGELVAFRLDSAGEYDDVDEFDG